MLIVPSVVDYHHLSFDSQPLLSFETQFGTTRISGVSSSFQTSHIQKLNALAPEAFSDVMLPTEFSTESLQLSAAGCF